MKKILNIIKNIFTYFIVAFAVFMVVFTMISVNTLNQPKKSLFGYKFFIVLSDSMSKTDFKAGDLIISKEVDPATLKVGDIITYQSTNSENYGEIVTHKIRELKEDAYGNPGFITYGTTTDTNDENVVAYSFVFGKYQGKLPGVGKFCQFLKTTPGYFVCIFAPLFILIMMQMINIIRLFQRYKKEQLIKLKKEKEKIKNDRAEIDKMMKELLSMKEQLSNDSKNKTSSVEKNKKVVQKSSTQKDSDK